MNIVIWRSNPKPSEIAQERRSNLRWIHCLPLWLEATRDHLKCEIWTSASLDCRLNYHICLRGIKINHILDYVMRSADTYYHSIQLSLLHIRLRSFASHRQNKRKNKTWTITLRSADITSNYSITLTDYHSFAFAHFIPKSVFIDNKDEVKIHRVSIIRY